MDLLFAAKDVTIGDSLMIAGIGIVIVMVVLVLLVGFLYLFKYIFMLIQKMENAKKSHKEKTQAAVTEQNSKQACLDEQLVAVITAAIQASYQNESTDNVVTPPFIIRNIKKI